MRFLLTMMLAAAAGVCAYTSLRCTRGNEYGALSLSGDSEALRSMELHAKKRRSRVRAKTSSKPSGVVQQDEGEGGVISKVVQEEPVLGQGTIGGETFVVPDLSAVQKSDSKLDPLAGTSAAKKKAYDEESNGLERFVQKMTAPTPKGQEPESVKLVKQITWVAVILLVLVEILVSVKVGGAPFDPSKVTLPSLPDFKAFTGGAGPPQLTPPK